ncbi:MAG: S8 family serine peptidase [Chitinophagales bacterium]
MKRVRPSFSFLLLLLIVFVSCQKDLTETGIEVSAVKAELDQYVLETIKSSNEAFDWNEQSDEIFYKALTLTDNILVLGYTDGITKNISARDAILKKVYQLENKQAENFGALDDVLIYKDDVLGFISVKISKFETLQQLRALPSVTFAEVNGYPIDMEVIHAFVGYPTVAHKSTSTNNNRRDMILDPYQTNPDYSQQVADYDNTFGIVIQRHNIDDVYRQYNIFGEGIGMGVIDNGMVPWARDLFMENGYGSRDAVGYHKPLWFFPWSDDDGIEPLETDALGISPLIEGQWLHGSGMIQSALVISPNADIVSVRASTAIIILFPSQIYGISSAIRAMGDQENIRVINMSMGTIFFFHRVKNSINYYYDKGKIIGCAAGTTDPAVKDILGVIFPASRWNTVAVTGINDRETTNGEFIAGTTAHTGKEVDFCVEKSAASSEATARMMGMFALLWSANPDMTREEVMDIMIQSSHFYQLQGQKDLDFGWGTVDMLQAVDAAMD